MYVANIRVTYKNTPSDILSQMALIEADMNELCQIFLDQPNIDEVVILQTCNRFEVFYSGKGETLGISQARRVMLNKFGAQIAEFMVTDKMVDTLRHLFLTASSIDSMIVGENQILSQVKNSYEYSCEQKLCGKVLGITFQKAISIGKRVRTETDISRGKVSISSAAVDLANQNNALEGKKVLIIGSGNMASLVADHLGSFNIGELVVVGRTPENLERFCRCHSSRYVLFDKLDSELKNSDIIFSATTCPRVLITRERIQNAVKNRTNTLTVVDIAMPEDVDSTVADFENVQYFCIDDLKEISDGNREQRFDEAQKAEEIINEELKKFINGLQNIHISNLLSHLNTYTEAIRVRELDRSLKMMGETEPKVGLILESLTKSLMKKMMHNFVTGLREYSGDEDDVKIFVDMFMGNKLKIGGNDLNGAGDGHPHAQGHPHTQGHPHAQGHPHDQGHPHAARGEEPEAQVQEDPHVSKKKDMVITDVPDGTNEKA